MNRLKQLFVCMILVCALHANAFSIDTAGSLLRVNSTFFNHPNLTELTWTADIYEYDYVPLSGYLFKIRIEFNLVNFSGASGGCYVGAMIQNVGHSFEDDAVGSTTVFAALGLYLTSLQDTWPESKHGVELLANPNTYPEFGRFFENIDMLDLCGKNIYTRQHVGDVSITEPVTLTWIVRKEGIVTDPVGNFSKNLNGDWIPLVGTFVIWNFKIKINDILYNVANYYLPIEYAEYIAPDGPLVLHQEYFGSATQILHAQKGTVRYKNIKAFDGVNSYYLNDWRIAYRIDDEAGNLDDRFGWKSDGKSLTSRVGHEEDIADCYRDLSHEFHLHLQPLLIQVPGDATTIQAGIDMADDGDTVLVAPGTYVEHINFSGKNITVGSHFLTSRDHSIIDQTVIRGNEVAPVVIFYDGENNAQLTGFTITNGSGLAGGGIALANSNPTLENLIISGNTATYGGGIHCNVADPELNNVIIRNNTANDYGGAIFCWGSSPVLKNVLIHDNMSENCGGVYCRMLCNSQLINTTLVNNVSSNLGDIVSAWNSNPELINTIVWGDSIYLDDTDGETSITISYSDIDGGKDGIITNLNGIVHWQDGNFSKDPLFAGGSPFDYHLSQYSPCIDSGTPDTAEYDLPASALDGEQRVMFGRIDMGAYESQSQYIAKLIYDFNQAGWYLVSFPFDFTYALPEYLLPQALVMSSWNAEDQMYQTVDQVEFTKGYWVAIPSQSTINIYGAPVNSYTTHLESGWHMIGSVIDTVDFSNPNDQPDGSVLTPAYGYDSEHKTYIEADSLFPGQGYWIAVLRECELTIGEMSPSLDKPISQASKDAFYQQFGFLPPSPPALNLDTRKTTDIPGNFNLLQNYPNPFNAVTTIKYQLPEKEQVTIQIYDILGKDVKTLVSEEQSAGYYNIAWDGRDNNGHIVQSGLYFYRIHAGVYHEVKKLIMLK